MTSTVPVTAKAPTYENDALFINKAFSVEGKYTGVSIDTPTFNRIKINKDPVTGAKSRELDSDEIKLPSGETVNVFKFMVKGKRLNIIARQQVKKEISDFKNTYLYVKNEDVPEFKREPMEALEDAMDALDL